MSYFEYTFETRIARHPVGTSRYTVVYLDETLHDALLLDPYAGLRIEADIGGGPRGGSQSGVARQGPAPVGPAAQCALITA